MRATAFFFLFVAILDGGCATPGKRTPQKELSDYLGMKAERGNVFAQGALDGVDYRGLLRGAIAKNESSLAGIFRYTAYGQLMGEGAEANCDIVGQLLRLWGDAAYARVLAAEPPKVQKAIIDALDYAWPYPGWRPTDYPRTYRLVTHDTSYRQSCPK